MREFSMTISSVSVPPESRFEVLNPATNDVYGYSPSCSPEQLDDAMKAALAALPGWSHDADKRRRALAMAGKAITDAVDEVALILTSEQGKPLAEAKQEVSFTGQLMQYYAEMDFPREIIRDDDSVLVELRRRPVGVVAAITAWNYPLTIMAFKVAPALRAGNTVVLKPSPYTPLSTLAVGELLRDVLPPGVLNVVSGGNELGAQMSSHPVPRKVSFTGSIATGKKVAVSAAGDLKRMTLELGGNDPAIVLADAVVPEIADTIFWSAFRNCGQACNAIKRVYVHESLHDELAEALAERARSVKVGDGLAEGTQLGPLNNRPQREVVRDLVTAAIGSGALAIAGGKEIAGEGNFFEPTILVNLPSGARIVDEEQFGPALPLIRYRDLEYAVEQANRTHHGLSASVWSSDADRATEVAMQLECGTAWVNTHQARVPGQPFGGAKWSGFGRENGLAGLLEFTEPQVLHRLKS